MFLSRFLYVILLISAVFFFLLYDNILSLYLLVFAFIFPLICAIIIFIAKFKVKIALTSNYNSVNKNEDCMFSIQLTNTSIFSIPNSKLEVCYYNSFDNKNETFYLFVPIQSKNQEKISFSIKSAHCGKIIVSLKSIRFFDFLKLNSFNMEINQTAETIIFPQFFEINAYVMNNLDLNFDIDIFSKTKRGDDPSEVFNIREYIGGDKINRIHWKLSEKQDTLLVKDYSLPMNNYVFIVIEMIVDFSNLNYMAYIDTIIESFLSVSNFLIENMVLHCVGWYSVLEKQVYYEEINNVDDLSIIVNKLLDCKSYDKNFHAFERLIRIETAKKYTNIIYITPQIDKNCYSFLSNSEQSEMATIFLATDNSSSNYQKGIVPSDDSKVQIVPIKISQIQASIQELIL